jgi:hypothetical protein
MDSTNIQDKPINAKRQALSELSRQVAPLVKMEQYGNINEALIACYQTEEHKYFKTLRQWNREGMQVKKGSEAFLLWSRPKTQYKKAEGIPTQEEDYSFFPLCFLFSNSQVEPSKKNTDAIA